MLRALVPGLYTAPAVFLEQVFIQVIVPPDLVVAAENDHALASLVVLRRRSCTPVQWTFLLHSARRVMVLLARHSENTVPLRRIEAKFKHGVKNQGLVTGNLLHTAIDNQRVCVVSVHHHML